MIIKEIFGNIQAISKFKGRIRKIICNLLNKYLVDNGFIVTSFSNYPSVLSFDLRVGDLICITIFEDGKHFICKPFYLFYLDLVSERIHELEWILCQNLKNYQINKNL